MTYVVVQRGCNRRFYISVACTACAKAADAKPVGSHFFTDIIDAHAYAEDICFGKNPLIRRKDFDCFHAQIR